MADALTIALILLEVIVNKSSIEIRNIENFFIPCPCKRAWNFFKPKEIQKPKEILILFVMYLASHHVSVPTLVTA